MNEVLALRRNGSTWKSAGIFALLPVTGAAVLAADAPAGASVADPVAGPAAAFFADDAALPASAPIPEYCIGLAECSWRGLRNMRTTKKTAAISAASINTSIIL